MKKLLFLAAGLVSALLLPAQENEISWGQQSESGSTDASYLPLGWVNGHYYTIQIDNKDGLLINVNSSMDIEKQTPLLTGQKKFEADLAFIRDGKLHLIMSNYEGGEKTNYARVSSYSMDGKATNTKLKKIADVKVERNSENTEFRYSFSADSSKLLILEEHDMKGDEAAKVSLIVINTDGFTEAWSKTEEIPYDDKSFQLISAAVENNGDVMMLGVFEGEDGKRLEKFTSLVFSIGAEAKMTERPLKLENKFISSATIRFVNDDKAFITGFYNELTEKGKSEGIQGAFIALVDPSNPAELNLKAKDLTAEVKTAISPSGALAQLFDTDELNAYFIHDISVNPDGSGYVIAEQRYVIQSEDERSVTRSYYFNHLIAYRFDTNQQIQWISSVPKLQNTSISTIKIGVVPLSFWYFPGSAIRYAYKYNSFVSTEKNGNIYVLYNDHRDNGDARTLKETKMMSNKNKAMATLLTISPDGEWEKEQLFRGKDLEVILETSSSYTTTEAGFTISAERGKALQYGKLDL